MQFAFSSIVKIISENIEVRIYAEMRLFYKKLINL